MKARILISFSIVVLLLIFLLQGVGIYRAYGNHVKETQSILNDCFEQSFVEGIGGQVNSLPLAVGTVTHLNFMPYSMYLSKKMKESKNEMTLYFAQQTSVILQKVYHAEELPLVTLDTLLTCKLQKKSVEGKITIRKFKTETGEDLEFTQPYVSAGIGVFTSRRAFINKEKGIAVEAVLQTPFLWGIRKILLLFLGTSLALGIVVFAFVKQIRSINFQHHNIEEQRNSFYTLAEHMKSPVTDLLSDISRSEWSRIEEQSVHLLNGTEQTLLKAKLEAQKEKKKYFSLKVLPLIALLSALILLLIWTGYLYQDNRKKMGQVVNDCFDNMFYNETIRRMKLYRQINGYYLEKAEKSDTMIFSPYYERQRLALNAFMREKKIALIATHVHVGTEDIREKSEISDNAYYGYNNQNTIDTYSKIPIPFSLHYADSLFIRFLEEHRMPTDAGIRMCRYPSEELMIYTGNPFPGILDFRTNMIALNKDSTVFIEGVVSSTTKYIFSSIWYLLVPLEILFLFICICVIFQIRLLYMQRRLEQFQKDFTYAMVHDMKSPLNSILMGAHSLASGKLANKPEKEQKYKQVMTEECEHLLALSGRVLLLTQLDKGHLQLNIEEVSLRPLIDDLIAKISLKTSKKIEFNTLYHRCETVYADAFCLREVLSNLLDNAIKYSRDEVKIDIICESEKGFSKIKICDNGLGIPVKDLSRIFNRFERSVAAARSGKGGATGFGLGLNYVQQVMLAHEGRVEVESEEGRFSEFTLYFPVRE